MSHRFEGTEGKIRLIDAISDLADECGATRAMF
jgi:hypothetical protein